ncbi:hypothetical protein U1Q18_040598 [Sarracenia purpurea var. burkii]
MVLRIQSRFALTLLWVASPSVALEGEAVETVAEKQAEVSVEEEAVVKVGEQHIPDVLWSKNEEETTHAPKVLDGSHHPEQDFRSAQSKPWGEKQHPKLPQL